MTSLTEPSLPKWCKEINGIIEKAAKKYGLTVEEVVEAVRSGDN